jgi:hypothetical protein
MSVGWSADPFGIHEERYLSEGQPTKLVRDGGVESYDEPPTASPTPTNPPAPGSHPHLYLHRHRGSSGAGGSARLTPSFRPDVAAGGARDHGNQGANKVPSQARARRKTTLLRRVTAAATAVSVVTVLVTVVVSSASSRSLSIGDSAHTRVTPEPPSTVPVATIPPAGTTPSQQSTSPVEHPVQAYKWIESTSGNASAPFDPADPSSPRAEAPVVGPGAWSPVVDPGGQDVTEGDAGAYTVGLQGSIASTSPTSLSVQDVSESPQIAGLQFSFSPTQIVTGQTSTLVVSTSSATVTGVVTWDVCASAGSDTQCAGPVEIDVLPAVTSFNATVSFSAVNVAQSGTYCQFALTCFSIQQNFVVNTPDAGGSRTQYLIQNILVVEVQPPSFGGVNTQRVYVRQTYDIFSLDPSEAVLLDGAGANNGSCSGPGSTGGEGWSGNWVQTNPGAPLNLDSSLVAVSGGDDVSLSASSASIPCTLPVELPAGSYVVASPGDAPWLAFPKELPEVAVVGMPGGNTVDFANSTTGSVALSLGTAALEGAPTCALGLGFDQSITLEQSEGLAWAPVGAPESGCLSGGGATFADSPSATDQGLAVELQS